jgi:hypothetical protein
MTDKKKLLAFISERGATYVELQEEFAALHTVWEDWQERVQEAQRLGVVALDGTPLVHPVHSLNKLTHAQ